MRIHPHWIKVGLTAAGGLIVLTAAKVLVTPPPLTPVAVLKHSLALGAPITVHNITWIKMVKPPVGSITQATAFQNMVASHALVAGTSLVRQDLTAPMHITGLKPGEVEWLVALSGSNSGVPFLGERVDVWDNPGTGTATVMARGVRVMALYTGNGTPIGPGSPGANGTTQPNSTNAGIVGLAVPYPVLSSLLPLTKPQLVPDPNVQTFTWITASASTPPSTTATSSTSSHSSHASSPTSATTSASHTTTSPTKTTAKTSTAAAHSKA